MNKTILITTHSKTDELKQAIQHLVACKNFYEYHLVIVYHEEVVTTDTFVKNINLKQFTSIPVNGSKKTKLENINHNRILGLNYCFDECNADYVVVIEDDVLCGYDTLVFCDKLIERYRENKNFRGINLGSKEKYNEAKRQEYGIFRYGLFGQGSAITKQTWARIKALNLLNELSDQGFDFLVEYYYKTGFVIMPRCSRYVDIGWNGTHTPKDPNDDYYRRLRESWVGASYFPDIDYQCMRFQFEWREDCTPYDEYKNLVFRAHFEMYRLKQRLKKTLRKFRML
jgi:hypothetical protein